MVGVASRNRMRSINSSACFISSIDCFLMKSPRRVVAPVVTHLGVQEILVDGRELLAQSEVELIDHLSVPAHSAASLAARRQWRVPRHRMPDSAKRSNSKWGGRPRAAVLQY